METKDLNSLLKNSSTAQIFFNSLPDYVQGGVMLNASQITTEEELHRCADSVIHEFE